MKKITDEELNKVIELHGLWVLDNTKGERANLSRIDLSYKDLSDVNLRYADVSNSNFSNSDLSEVDLGYANAVNTDFTDAVLVHINFTNTYLMGAKFVNANMSDATILHSFMDGTNFKNANLTSAFLMDLELTNTNFTKANLTEAYFGATSLLGSNLTGANLTEADLQGITSTEFLKGLNTIAVQINTEKRKNGIIRYWKEIDVLTTSDGFQGTMTEFKKHVEISFNDDLKLNKRFERAISYIEMEAQE